MEKDKIRELEEDELDEVAGGADSTALELNGSGEKENKKPGRDISKILDGRTGGFSPNGPFFG